jgi:hypothetical protein
MTLETAHELWGAEAVERALRDEQPEPITAALTRDIERHAQHSPGAFRTWALAQPWPRFCAIVRIVSGAAREELDDGD